MDQYSNINGLGETAARFRNNFNIPIRYHIRREIRKTQNDADAPNGRNMRDESKKSAGVSDIWLYCAAPKPQSR